MSRKPPIVVTKLTQPFWDGVRQKKFMLQYDPKAGRHQFYPRPLSLYSSGSELEWREARGEGRLDAVTLCHAPAPGFEAETPYILGLVRLAEGPRVFARIINAAYEDLRLGQAMRLAWAEDSEQGVTYQFEPVP